MDQIFLDIIAKKAQERFPADYSGYNIAKTSGYINGCVQTMELSERILLPILQDLCPDKANEIWTQFQQKLIETLTK